MVAELSEQVMDYLVTLLQGITTAGGYQTQIGSKVYRNQAPREFSTSELPAITLKKIAGSSRWHIRGANEEVLTVRIRGIVAAASPDEFTESTALMGDIRKRLESDPRLGSNPSQLAERTWVEESRMHDPSRASNLHICSVLFKAVIRSSRTDPTAVKQV